MSNRDELLAWLKGNPDMMVVLVDTGTDQRWTLVRSLNNYRAVFPHHRILEIVDANEDVGAA